MITKKTGMIIILIGIFFSVSATSYAAVKDRIVAVVNGEAITLYEFDRVLQPVLQKIDAGYKGPNKDEYKVEARQVMLNRLIEEKLIDQETKKFGFIVKDDEVNATIKGMLAAKNMSLEEFKKILAKEGMTLEQYKEKTKEQMLRVRLLKFEVNYKIAVTDDEIGEYYKKHLDEYEGNEAVRIKQIVLLTPPKADRQTRDKIRAKINNLRQQIMKGDSFDMLAAKYSQGPAANLGGDIGFVEKGTMVSEVDRVAFSLKQEELSPVIESSVGYHIIKVIDRRGKGVKTTESARQEIKAKIEEEKTEKKFNEWIGELKKKALIEIRL